MLLNLLIAKAKSVGLVAGTALATVALAGGGAVAITAVSHDGELHEEGTAVEQIEDLGAGATVSDSPTVGIELPAKKAKTPPPLPSDFVCDESKNHGQNVSAYARSLPKGPGRGEKVSAVAQSDCGKSAGEDELETAESEADEPKADKPAKDKAAKPKRAGKGKPEHAGKGAQKSGGKR